MVPMKKSCCCGVSVCSDVWAAWPWEEEMWAKAGTVCFVLLSWMGGWMDGWMGEKVVNESFRLVII